ncbi:MAG TPA: ROK family protein [Streptosporangiaceae bacterium]
MLAVVAGLWVAISPWFLALQAPVARNSTANDLIIGLAVAAVGLFAIAGARGFMGLEMGSLLLGIWLITSPFILATKFTIDTPMYWSNIWSGGLIAVLALASLAGLRRARERAGGATGGGMTPHDQGFVAGIYFGGTKAALVAADLEGHRLTVWRIPAQAGGGADTMVERVLAAARDLVAQTTAHTGWRMAAAAAVSTGAARPGRILLATDNPGRRGLTPEEVVRELSTQRVAVSNEVQAAALAEARWGALARDGPGLFVNLGTGLSVALVVNGRVVTGAHGAAGEIGYRRLGISAGRALAPGHPRVDEAISFELAGEPLDTLAAHVASLVLAVDPATIAVGGGLNHAAGIILPRLRATLERAVPFPPKVRLAHFTRDAPLVGAVALALDVAEPGRRPIRAAPADEKAAAHEQRKASRAGPRCGSYRLACHWQWNGGNACEPRRGSGG